MKTLILAVLVNLVFFVQINCEDKTTQKNGALFYRIAIEEFNKVGNALIESRDGNTLYYGYRTSNTNGTVGRVHYEFSNVKERPSAVSTQPTMIRANITEDNRMRVETLLPETEITGVLVIKRQGSQTAIYNGPFNISFGKIKMQSLGGTDDVLGTRIQDSLHTVTLSFSECKIDKEAVNIDDKVSLIVGKADSYMTVSEQRQMYQHLLCDQYRLALVFAFGASSLEYTIANHTLTVRTEATALEIKNDGLYISQTVISTSVDRRFHFTAGQNDRPSRKLPFSDDRYQFEVAVGVDAFEQIFSGIKQKLGIGVRPLPLLDFIPLKDMNKYELGTNSLAVGMLFPKMGAVFPDSVLELSITDMNFTFNVDERKLSVNIDLTCNAFVTLNCDKNRTYSAMNFTLRVALPVQVGYDNTFLTMQVLGFGGNMTVLNSNIGHVADDQFRTLVAYAATKVGPKQWNKINENIQGIRIRDFLPPGVYENVQAIKLVKDHIVICGNLSTTDPMLKKLNRSDISWVGQPMQASDKYLNVKDNTPVRLQAMAERNCKPEEKTTSPSSITDTVHHGNEILLLIASLILIIRAC